MVVRDPVNAEKSVTADYLTRNALPDLYEFAYSDGSKETLALSWDKKYAYSETAVLYTGTATDSSGRKASLKLTVTGKIGESDLTELIAETEKILSSQEYVASHPNGVRCGGEGVPGRREGVCGRARQARNIKGYTSRSQTTIFP